MPAAVRERIVAEHRRGESLSGIARRLNAEDVPTAHGGRWWPSTIAAVLRSVELDAEAEGVAA